MAESRKGVFARNIASNAAGYLITAIVALVLTPFVQHRLGGTGATGEHESSGFVWALWTVMVSITGYYGLFDLGIRSAVGQYVTRYWAQNDMAGVNRTLNTAMVLLCGVAALALLATVLIAMTLHLWVEPKGVTTSQMRWAMLVVGSGVALSLPMALWSTVTYTRERFDIAQGIAIAESLLRLPVTYWVLSQDYGIVGLALGTTGLQLAAWLTRMVVAYRLMPGLRLDPRLFDRGSIRELSSFGLYNVVVNAADRVVLSTDMILIVAIAPLGAIYYGNGSILIPYFVQVVLMVTWTLTPYATKCDARGDREALRGLLRNGTRGSLFLAAVVAAGLLLTGDAFLDLWIKTESHLRSPDHASAFTILVILTWATLVRSSSSAGRQILFGMRRMGLLAGLSLAEALLNLGISIGLIYAMGIAGVAIGSLIPVVLIYGVVQNLYLLKALEMSPVSFFALLLRSSAPAMLAMAGVSWWVDTWLAVDSWPRLIGKALLLVAAALLVGYWVVLEPRERRALLGRFRLTSHVPPPRT